MGIQYLQDYLTKNFDSTSESFLEIIPSQSTLHIDGSGFIFYILRLMCPYEHISNDRNSLDKYLSNKFYRFGGNYNTFEQIVISEITKLTNYFKVIIYFDGCSRLKNKLRERNYEWFEIPKWKRIENGNFESVPIAPLYPMCLKHKIKELIDNDHIIYVENNESDPIIAKNAQNQSNHYIFADDR